MSKSNYLKIYDEKIKTANDAINNNKIIIQELSSVKQNNYIRIDKKIYFKRTDLLQILVQNLTYYEMVLSQIHKNNIFYKKTTTKNILDYDNTRVNYNNNQIKIMRSDIQNYMNIPCQYCKTK